MTRFHPSTTPEEARHLTGMCLQAIASGWPVLFYKPAAIAGAQPVLDLDSMIGAAADMAATLTQAVDFRMEADLLPPDRGN